MKLRPALPLWVCTAALAMSSMGCWGMREIDQLAFVMAIGIDAGHRSDSYIVSYQIPLPRSSASGTGGGGGGGGSSGGGAVPTVWVPSTEGASIIDATRRLAEFDPRRAYFAHANVIVLGEDLVKEGINPILDFLDRSLELRRTALVYMARGTAQNIMEAKPAMDAVLSQAVRGEAKWGVEAGVSAPLPLQEMLHNVSFPGKQVALPIIYRTTGTVPVSETGGKSNPSSQGSSSLKEPVGPELKIEGFAILNEGKLIGTLNRYESRGYLWLMGKIKGGIVLVKGPGDRGEAGLEIRQAKSRVTPMVTGGKLRYQVVISTDFDVAEVEGAVDISKEEVRRSLSRRLAETIRNDIRSALDKIQKEYRSDVLGFGESLFRYHFDVWKKSQDRWKTIFPDIPVDIQVETSFRETGRTGRPLQNLVRKPLYQGGTGK